MAKQYQVTGAYVTHIPVDTETGQRLVDLNHGAILPEGVPQDKIDHLLSVDLIGEVGAADEPAPSGAEDVAPASELPPDGSAPPQNANKATWVEYAVSKGMDRSEAEAMSKTDLIGALRA